MAGQSPRIRAFQLGTLRLANAIFLME